MLPMITDMMAALEHGPRSLQRQLARARARHYGLAWPPRTPVTLGADLGASGAYWVSRH